MSMTFNGDDHGSQFQVVAELSSFGNVVLQIHYMDSDGRRILTVGVYRPEVLAITCASRIIDEFKLNLVVPDAVLVRSDNTIIPGYQPIGSFPLELYETMSLESLERINDIRRPRVPYYTPNYTNNRHP